MWPDVSRAGLLATLDTSEEELQLLVQILDGARDGSQMTFLRHLLGDRFLLFLDVFSGEKVRFPTREQVVRQYQQIRVYRALTRLGYQGSADERGLEKLAQVARRYGVTSSEAGKAFEAVSKALCGKGV